jgi:glycosyltransferase involved in cell wall biosynthesis
MQAGSDENQRLRVVTLVDGIGLMGGGERLAREIVVRLDPARFDRTLCVSRWSPERAADPAAAEALAELEREGVRFLGLRRRASFDLAAWRPLVSRLRRERVDILHAHKFGSNVWAAALRPLTSTPVVLAHEHTWSFEGQPIRKFLDRALIARQVDRIITVSRADRHRMADVEGIDPAKLLFVPNGIPAPEAGTGVDLRPELGVSPEAPVVGTVCALRPQKALDVLVRAAAHLRASVPNVRVLIVGDGEERGRIESLVAELGLEDTVSLLGRRDDVPDVLRAFDVAACSSDFEGTPLSILEYMEAALPVVATRVGGVPDLIEDGVNGRLVEPQDPERLAAGIASLLGDPELARQMGQRGQARRRSEFDISNTVREIERLYESLAAVERSAP